MARVATFSLHTSPLAQPGAGDGGGMNVYVHALASALARAGVEIDVLTRADHAEQPPVVEVEPRYRVVHLDAGPKRPVSRQELVDLVPALTEAARDHLAGASTDAMHANYWVSGAVAHRLKHDLALPLVATFHTLAAVKARAGIADDPVERSEIERDVARCADLLLASTVDERNDLVQRCGADPDRIEILPPGVDRSEFSPGDREAARARLGLDGRRVLLFVGRIQPLKGVDVAIRAVGALGDPRATLLVVGGPSGPEGEVELARLHALVAELGLGEQVRFTAPQPHDALDTFYRAAHVCLVPSRTESFGLVALEAAACATPVVAADVGGLRAVVVDGETGLLVDGYDPDALAAATTELLDDPGLARVMGTRAAARATGFTWGLAAARLRRLVADLGARAPVECR